MEKENNIFLSKYINVDDPLKDKDIIHKLSVVTTHYVYRNGPIESMDADTTKNIYDSDMKILNKLIVNRLAAIFKIILDKDKINKIKEKYKDGYIYIRELVDATMRYVFEEGFLKEEVIIENLNNKEIKKLYNFMKFRLEVVFDMILEDNKEDIKKYLAYGILYGNSWDYAVPELLTFDEFLKKFKNYA